MLDVRRVMSDVRTRGAARSSLLTSHIQPLASDIAAARLAKKQQHRQAGDNAVSREPVQSASFHHPAQNPQRGQS